MDDRLEFSARPTVREPPSSHGYEASAVDGSTKTNGLYNTNIRHGFGVISEEWMQYLADSFCIYYEDKRHDTGGHAGDKDGDHSGGSWRITDRHRTVNAALVMCLNLGVDPPDVIKTQPAAKLEAWVNPSHITDSKKAIEQIGKNLQAQYETLSTRAKYKQCLDPNVEDAKRFCMGLRRSAREERILFHYNGHGVPRPTSSGEIWVFNRGYTQYIPVSVYELQSWLGAPVIYCYDCSGAGNIVKSFNRFVEERKTEELQNGGTRDPGSTPAAAYDACIQIAACRADEILPMNPQLPADLFTCCITMPVEIAVKWFVMQNNSMLGLDPETIDIPGKITDRRTPLGELNWIFTAITDNIAWSALDTTLFKRLFRQDLVVAAMFRNFLLAVRIMRVHNCHPVSSPELPDTHDHPLWASWDLAVNQCLLQLPAMKKAEQEGQVYEYEHSDFFEQQLTAFEVWLKYKFTDLSRPPDQLPVLLQVLLSQIHRLRALVLLSRYLDLGPAAVRISLSIGFFIYVLKLLQSPAPELKPVLVFIWARIMAVEAEDVQHELVKENGYSYFVNILVQAADAKTHPDDRNVNGSAGGLNGVNGSANHAANGSIDGDMSLDGTETITDSSGEPLGTNSPGNEFEHLAMCCFILAQFTRGYAAGQRMCAVPTLLDALAVHMGEVESPLLRQWACLCAGELLENTEARALADSQCPQLVPCIINLLKDPIPEVRASALTALGSYINEKTVRRAIGVALDASPLVRFEAVVFLSRTVVSNMGFYLVCAFTTLEEDFSVQRDGELRSETPASGSIWLAAWRVLLVLTFDPDSGVRSNAQNVVDYVFAKLAKSPLGPDAAKITDYLVTPRDAGMGPSPASPPPASQLGPAAQGLVASSRIVSGPTRGPISNGSSPPDRGAMVRSTSMPLIETLSSQSQSQVGSPASATHVGDAWRAARSWLLGPERVEPNTPLPETETLPVPPTAGAAQVDLSQEVKLPLKSNFYAWCVEYFTEPQLRRMEPDEPGSEKHLERIWRKGRNETIMAETQVQKDLAVTGTWNNVIATMKPQSPPRRLMFAQFEPHLVSCDYHDGVTVFDWTSTQRLNQFSNNNPQGTRIADIKFINEDDQPLLLTAANDGVARVYKNYASPEDIEQVTSWWLLADLVPNHRLAPVSIEWQQSRGALLVGGDIPVVRVWDAASEMAVEDIPVRTTSRLTSLTSDQVTGTMVVAGFENGSVHVYDRRLAKHQAHVQQWNHHDSYILNVRMQRGGAREIMSGSWDGTVNLWDLRSPQPVTSFKAHTREMHAVDLHEHAPVIATASRVVGIWSTAARRVSTVRSPVSYLQRFAAVSALAFHPHRIMMAVNTGDVVNVFKCT